MSVSESNEQVLVLGAGYTGSAVLRLARARGYRVRAFVRSAEAKVALEREGVDVLQAPLFDSSIAEFVDARTHVLISFPPDGVTDQRIAGALASAASINYVSTTSVYGPIRGVIDESTPLPSTASEKAARVLAAEQIYRALGGNVLRCPGIYGPDRGLHIRVLRGQHKIPGDGTRYVSRIHVEDLAALLLAATRRRGETFVVGDLQPARHIDVVRFICDTYHVPFPDFVPLEASPRSLQGDRRVDSKHALEELAVELRYPNYKVGMAKENVRLIDNIKP